MMEAEVVRSRQAQQDDKENADQLSFDDFLANYFSYLGQSINMAWGRKPIIRQRNAWY